MKEQIHTIPVNDGFDSGDECPFCYLERQAEGGLTLGDLSRGQVRILTEEEIRDLENPL